MDINTMIRELEYEAKKHSNDRVDTFGTNITAMCYEVANKLKVVLEVKDEIIKEMEDPINFTPGVYYWVDVVNKKFNKL